MSLKLSKGQYKKLFDFEKYFGFISFINNNYKINDNPNILF